MNRQTRFYSLILLIIIVLCFGAMPSSAGTVEMQMMEQKVQRTPAGATRVQPGQVREIQAKKIIVSNDLAISKFTISPKSINAGDKVKLTALVKNSGNQILHNIVVRFINMKTHKKLDEKRVTLVSGQARQLVITTSIEGLGGTKVQAIIDPDNRIKESNERNNKAVAYVTVNAVAKLTQLKAVQPATALKTKGIIQKSVVKKSFKPLTGGSNDLTCSVPLVGPSFSDKAFVGFHRVEKNNRVVIKVMNKAMISNPEAFYVGLGIHGKAAIGSKSSWDYSFKVPKGGIIPKKFIYASFKLKKDVTETTRLIAGVDIENKIQETDENNNYSKPFNIKFAKPAPSPVTTADLQCSVEITDGFYHGDGTEVKIKVINHGRQTSSPFVVGFGEENQVKIGSKAQWIGTAVVPKIFAYQHVYVLIPCTKQQLKADQTYIKTYIAAVDIYEEVDEKKYENNNYSKPFKHMLSVGQKNWPPPFSGKNFKAFDIREPKKGKSFPVGADIGMRWYPTQTYNNLSLDEKEKYQKMNVDLVNYKTKQIVAKLDRDISNSPMNSYNHHFWMVTLPKTVKKGEYYLSLITPFAGGWGASRPFSVYVPKNNSATQLDNKHNQGQAAIFPKGIDKAYAQDDVKLLELRNMKIKSIVPTSKAYSGKSGKALLTSLKIEVEYESNQPFMFAESLNAPYNLPPDSVYSLAVIKLGVEGKVGAESIGGYPWKVIYNGKIKKNTGKFHINGKLNYPTGVLPKGKHTFTIEAETVGYVHGLRIVGLLPQLRYKCIAERVPFLNIDLQVKLFYDGKSTRTYKVNRKQITINKPVAWYDMDTTKNKYYNSDGTSVGVFWVEPYDCMKTK